MLDKNDQLHAKTRSQLIGASVARREDAPLVTGSAQYVADVQLDEPLHISFVRASEANCRIDEVHCDDAQEMHGVAAVFSGRDCPELSPLEVNPILGEAENQNFEMLARNALHFVGQPFAAVLADTLSHAEDAAEAIYADTSDADSQRVTSLRAAIDTDCCPVFDKRWQEGDFEKASSAAHATVEVEVEHSRLAPSPMETRGIAVKYHEDTGGVTVWLSTQTPHRARKMLAKILDCDGASIRLISPDVGGAFGMKASLYPEEIFAVWAAMTLKRSVRWIAWRNEDFLAASHGRGLICRGKLAVDKEGTFLALDAEINAPLGSWLTTSSAIPAWNAARILPGPYRVTNYDLRSRAYETHTAPFGIYRGAGRPEAAMLMERLVEEASRKTGIESNELRRKNLLAPDELDQRRSTDVRLDSGNYTELLDRLMNSDHYKEALETRSKLRNAGRLAGIGTGFFVEPSGQGWESATIRCHPDGKIEVLSGGSTQGHGRETAYAQIAADELDVDPDNITVRCGDTQDCPNGIGALASRSTGIGGSAVRAAAQELRAKLDNHTNPKETVEACVKYHADGEAWGYGCYLAEVEIDPDTGKLTVHHMHCLDDAGKIINPKMVSGQIIGGVAQGLGEALMESVSYDDSGQLQTGSLMDYALPRASDMPAITLDHTETPSPRNLLGAKGVGEAGTIGAPIAIFNATADALAELGNANLSMPLTSNKIWNEIERLQQEQE